MGLHELLSNDLVREITLLIINLGEQTSEVLLDRYAKHLKSRCDLETYDDNTELNLIKIQFESSLREYYKITEQDLDDVIVPYGYVIKFVRTGNSVFLEQFLAESIKEVVSYINFSNRNNKDTSYLTPEDSTLIYLYKNINSIGDNLIRIIATAYLSRKRMAFLKQRIVQLKTKIENTSDNKRTIEQSETLNYINYNSFNAFLEVLKHNYLKPDYTFFNFKSSVEEMYRALQHEILENFIFLKPHEKEGYLKRLAFEIYDLHTTNNNIQYTEQKKEEYCIKYKSNEHQGFIKEILNNPPDFLYNNYPEYNRDIEVIQNIYYQCFYRDIVNKVLDFINEQLNNAIDRKDRDSTKLKEKKEEASKEEPSNEKPLGFELKISKKVLPTFYSLLINAELISNETTEEQFANIFNRGNTKFINPIRWMENETLLVYMLDNMMGVILNDSYYERYAIAAKCFYKHNFNDLKNKQLARASSNYIQNKTKKPTNHDKIDKILEKIYVPV